MTPVLRSRPILDRQVCREGPFVASVCHPQITSSPSQVPGMGGATTVKLVAGGLAIALTVPLT